MAGVWAGAAGPVLAYAALPRLDEIRALIRDGRYDDARQASQQRLAEVEKAAGPDSAATAEALDLVADTLQRCGDATRPETLAAAERALALKERLFGANALEVADTLTVLGRIVFERGEARGARELVERGLALRERSLQADDPRIAESLTDLGLVLLDLDDTSAARAAFERALHILDPLPERRAERAATLSCLGLVLHRQGDRDTARQYLEGAASDLEATLGPDHPTVATALHRLADLRLTLADGAGAKATITRALAIREAALGPQHPLVADSLNLFGNILRLRGDLPGARASYEQALAIYEGVLGPEHPRVASPLNNLAYVLYVLGDVAAAKPLCERSIAVREKTLGPDHIRLAMSLNTQFSILNALGDHEGARRALERSLTIKEKARGPKSEDATIARHNLARFLDQTGNWEEADVLFQEVLQTYAETLGEEHVRFASALVDHAHLVGETGDHAGARERLSRALEIRRRVLGPDHPDVAAAGMFLGTAALWTGDRSAAVDETLAAAGVSRNHLRLTAARLSEREALGLRETWSSALDVALTAVAGGSPAGDDVARVWDELIRSRALVLDEMAARHRNALELESPEARRRVEALDRARAALAELALEPVDPQDRIVHEARLAGAQAEKERRERGLARRSSDFRRELGMRNAGRAEVVASLPKDTALVAFYQYGRADVPELTAADRAAGVKFERPREYVCWVQRPGAESPTLVALGPADEIDRLVERWREQVSAPPDSAAAEARYLKVAEGLRQRIWDPLTPHIGGAQTVLIVPDGKLYLVSFATLPTSEGSYLAENGPLIHYLSAERDAVGAAVNARGKRSAQPLLLVGGVDYDAGRPEDVSSSTGLEFDSLPGARAEVEEVKAIWTRRDPARELTGSDASETAFRQLAPSHRVLHIATHAFFLADTVSSKDDAENPLLFSGLAFAGANRAEPGEGRDDGILTAEEIASLDLRGVEWVVLSGCGSGLGYVSNGEGILGLRRVFQVAGARTLILSLWKIADHPTRDWMANLYRARFDGASTTESVRQASLRVLENRRRGGVTTHPFFWGAFVAVGDPR